MILDLWLKLLTGYPLSSQSGTVPDWKGSDSSPLNHSFESFAWSETDEISETETTATSLRKLKKSSADVGFILITSEFKVKYLLGILYLGSLWLQMPFFPRDFTRYKLLNC